MREVDWPPEELGVKGSANGGELGSGDHAKIDDVLNEFGVSLTHTLTSPANVECRRSCFCKSMFWCYLIDETSRNKVSIRLCMLLSCR